MAGKRVAKALALPDVYFRWFGFDGHALVVVPHPSGVDRLYNDPVVRFQAGMCLRRAGGTKLSAHARKRFEEELRTPEEAPLKPAEGR